MLILWSQPPMIRPSIAARTFFALLAASSMALLTACTPPADNGAGETEAGAAEAPGHSSAAAAAAEAIVPEDLEAHIRYLASDELGGRGPGSEGDALARRYLIDQLAALGYQPAGVNGSWEQPFDIVGVHSTAPEEWTFRADGKSVDLAWWDEYIASSGVQTPTARIDDAELVFVGYGIQAPEYGWDDFSGADVTGKVLVILNNDPEWDPALFEGDRRLLYGRWTYKYEKAAQMGAAGAIIIHTTPSAGYPFQVVQTSWTGEQFEIPAGDEPRSQVEAWTTEAAMRSVLALAGHDLDALREAARSADFQPVPLGIRTSLDLSNELRRVETANVLGMLPGSDPALAREVVVYSAHHDHLGIGSPDAEGDDIYNGALDNAAGCAQVLAIAKAFTELPEPPSRSILIAFVAAEEQGLLGSAYFAQNPTVPAGLMAANINYDGGSIWGAASDVTFIGYGKSSLDRVVDLYAGHQGRTVKPDQFPDRGFFYRSDQFNFAKVGVPAIYLDNGTEIIGQDPAWGREQIEAWEAKDYHQPSDELTDEWRFDGMVQDAQLGFFCGVHVAERPELPEWNPGDEFEAARREALAAGG
jgi:Zn-dependent M28 family amino/carboxypeptidase